MTRRLQLRERVALLAFLALATVGLALAPPPLGAPIRKLANYSADGRDPIWNAKDVDGAALRRGGAILPDSPRETYFIQTRREPQLGHDLIGASLLFFLPARPAPSAREARWVLYYRAGTARPRGVRTYRLGDDIYLIRLART